MSLSIDAMEHKYDEQLRIVFEAITQLIEKDEIPKERIGCIKEGQIKYGKRSRKIEKSKENFGAWTS